MGQYFDNDSSLKEEKRMLDLYINDNKLSFVSDSGVFSNTKIDYGSYTFLNALLKEKELGDVLDVGCGYGTLGLTLSYFNKAKSVTMVDINIKAVELTKLNASRLNLTNIDAFVSDGFLAVTTNFDNIVINPPIRAGKKVIYKMFEDSRTHLKENGSLYIVIKKDLGANSAIKKLQELFNKVEVIKKDKGYFIIKSDI